jgi:hypothetical protein
MRKTVINLRTVPLSKSHKDIDAKAKIKNKSTLWIFNLKRNSVSLYLSQFFFSCLWLPILNRNRNGLEILQLYDLFLKMVILLNSEMDFNWSKYPICNHFFYLTIQLKAQKTKYLGSLPLSSNNFFSFFFFIFYFYVPKSWYIQHWRKNLSKGYSTYY